MRSWPALEVRADFSRPDLFQAALVDYAVAAVDDNAADRWRVFFDTPAERDRAHRALTAAFPGFSFASIDVPDEDWAARSQAGLRAIQVDNFIVAPPWDVPVSSTATTIVIQPSMGFGTGHHQTTRLCLRALQSIDVRGRSVVDVGTGSGVLAIAASLLGASTVVAIDDDADAVQAARENIALNPGATVDARVADLRAATLPVFDIVLANLTGGLLMQSATALLALAAPGGRLILSGFTRDEGEEVLAAFARRGAVSEEAEWRCATLELAPEGEERG